MTGDIVDKLRSYRPYLTGQGEWFGPEVCEDAATLIESLRSDNAAMRDLIEEARPVLIGMLHYRKVPEDAPIIKRIDATLSRIQERG